MPIKDRFHLGLHDRLLLTTANHGCLSRGRAPVQPGRLVAQFPEVEKIPAGTAAQIEQAKPRFLGKASRKAA
jgi:hypothetical protein